MASPAISLSGSPEDSTDPLPDGPNADEDREENESHWDLYKALNSALLSNANSETEEPVTVEKRAESLKNDLSELKGQHDCVVQYFRKLKSNHRRNSMRRFSFTTDTDIPDTDPDTIPEDNISQRSSLDRQLKEKLREIDCLTLENRKLSEREDDLEKQLMMSQRESTRLEREKMMEVNRLKEDLREEQLERHKVKQMLEEEVTQLREKLQDTKMKLQEKVRSAEQSKAELNISTELCTSSQKEVMELRVQLVSHEKSLALMLDALRTATIKISSLSEQGGTLRSPWKPGHKQEMSEYETAVKNMEEELQAHCKQWEDRRASIVQQTSEIAGLTETRKKLEEDVLKKIEEICERNARLNEVHELCSRAEANQKKLETALEVFKVQVQSLGQDKAKQECQNLRHEIEILQKKLEHERTTREVAEKRHQEQIQRQETRLSEERKMRVAVQSELEEEKRQTQTLEQRLNVERAKVENLDAKLREKMSVHNGQSSQVEYLREEVRNLTNRNKKLQEEVMDLNNRLLKASTEARIRMDSVVEERKKNEAMKWGESATDNEAFHAEHEDLKSGTLGVSYPSYFSLNSLSSVREQEQPSFRHHYSNPVTHGSSTSLHSHQETRSSTTVLTREHHLQNSRELLLNGDDQGSTHSLSQEGSSTDLEKDSQSQFPTSTHSNEPERNSASQSPASTHSNEPERNSASQSPASRHSSSPNSLLPTSDED